MRNIFIFFIIPAIIIAAFLLLVGYPKQKNDGKVLVKIRDHVFISEIAESEEELETGLSHRPFLCERCAMLFLLSENNQSGFWMKGMEFDLDIIWIKNNRIFYVEKKVDKNYAGIFKPPENADLVLEINSGLADKYGLNIGDEVSILERT